MIEYRNGVEGDALQSFLVTADSNLALAFYSLLTLSSFPTTIALSKESTISRANLRSVHGMTKMIFTMKVRNYSAFICIFLFLVLPPAPDYPHRKLSNETALP